MIEEFEDDNLSSHEDENAGQGDDINRIANDEPFDLEGWDSDIDWDAQSRMVNYIEFVTEILAGRNKGPLQDYLEDFDLDESIVQWLFGNLDYQLLDNSVFEEDARDILDEWLIGELTPPAALTKIKDLWEDYFDFGC